MPDQQTSKNERKTAFDVLFSVKRKAEPLSGALNRLLCARNLEDKRSRAFITQLVYGTLENIIRLDYIIDSFSKIKTKKMKPGIAIILELSAYQIIFMDSVPASAACDEAVKLTKKIGMSGLSGFVNAVLRNIADNYETVSMPDKDCFPEYESLKYSIPQWCLLRWEHDYGRERAVDIARNLRRRKIIFIRVNTSLISPSGLDQRLEAEGLKVYKNNSWPEYVLAIDGIDTISSIESFKEGLFYIQDISCVLSGEMYGLDVGGDVLDLCAAPGGKSINASLLLNEKGAGRVTSCDISDEKVALIKENVTTMKLSGIDILKCDATVFREDFKENFDVVIADVPCSGLGIIGRKPDIAIRLKEGDIDKLFELQRRIIDNGVQYVKKGGRFIYSTCTLNKTENEENAKYISEKHGMEMIEEKTFFPEEGFDGDGFFTAVFKKA